MKHCIYLLFLFFSISFFSQIEDPVKWSTSVKKVSETEYVLISKATIEKGWHLYSQYLPDDGPIKTSFEFNGVNKDIVLVGKSIEDEGIEGFDPTFEMNIKYFSEEATFKQKIKLTKANITKVLGVVEFMVCNDERCLAPEERDLEFKLTTGNGVAKNVDSEVIDNLTNDTKEERKGLLSLFFLSFLGGLAALLTPCVFPMIPMTVSFFTKQSKNKAAGIRNAVIYGISIIVIYVLIGLLVSAIFGPDALNSLATSVWFNIAFFIILLFFAASFLGAFELVLPSSWGTKIDAKADKGGYLGIFFMALALAIVSFSCTGPLVGSALVMAATTGERIAPIVSMLGFSSAIALPFALFAAFPGWLNSLPKSGGWLNTVKVVLGFLELALALKFLSNADLVLQAHLLEREVFIAVWIAIFATLALYLFGKIQLPHDSPTNHISVGRLGLGLLSLTFAIYMLPGMWGAPLKLINAFPPPQHYSESPYGVGSIQKSTTDKIVDTDLPDGAHLLPPYDILAFNDYDKGVAYAKKVGKPIMLDFTGHACVNCRKMEQDVWVKPNILNVLKKDVVLISLYVDDKRPLKENEVVMSKLKPGKKLKYIGQKWSEMQTIRYKTNTQPMYVLIDHNENNLVTPVGYTPDVNAYSQFLKSGIENFKK